MRNTQMWLLSLLGLAMAGVVSGCGSDAPATDQLQDEYARQDQIVCDCYAAFGYDTRESCLADYPITPAEWQCIQAAWSSAGLDPEQVASCLLPLERDYTQCIDALSCSDSNASCADSYDTGFEACFTDPQPVDDAFNNCL